MEWRPIVTAPRDGTPFWAYCMDGHQRVVEYNSGWWMDTEFCRDQDPTHWLPLLDPPKEAKKWKCPINMDGCTSNCGDYACGN